MQTLERVSSKILNYMTNGHYFFSSIIYLISLHAYTQEGVKVDVVGALNLLADGLQKSGSEDGNLNELLVIF